MSSASRMDADVAVLVVSCDKYQDLWRPFFTCFFRYWPDCPYPVHLGSNFETYDDDRVNKVCIGDDVDYSSNLLAMLTGIHQEWILLWIEDRVLSAPVSTRRISRVVEFAKREGASYVKLIASHPFALRPECERDLGEIPRGASYRVCMTVGLWRKSALVALLRRGESAWDIERRGSLRSGSMEGRFFSLCVSSRRDPPIVDTHLIIKGRLARGALGFLSRERIRDQMSSRPVQGIASHWYVRLYVAALDVRAYMRWWGGQLANAMRRQ